MLHLPRSPRLRRASTLLLAVTVSCLASTHAQAMTETARRDYLANLKSILPPAPEWDAWLARTGELPPDFDALPPHNELPDPLRFVDGRPVHTVADWAARRAEIRDLFERYVFGSLPPRARLAGSSVVASRRGEKCTVREVRLAFGPEDKASMRVELFVPDGEGPFPVFMAPAWGRDWARLALRRGYLCAIYAGSDSQDDAGPLAPLYPNYDFALLPRRAWSVSVVIDYLETLPEVDSKHIGLAGHSRDGKQALIAAALDERISAVAAMSTGVGGTTPWRYAGGWGMGEGIETTTRRFPTWFHPSLRFFTGREDRLPVDANLLVALVAPRACLVSYGEYDSVSHGWGDERCMESADRVYDLLRTSGRLGLLRRAGYHGVDTPDAERMLDWFDFEFDRPGAQPWTEEPLYPSADDSGVYAPSSPARTGSPAPLRLEALLGTAPTREAWGEQAGAIRSAAQWLLGQPPPNVPASAPRLDLAGSPPPPPRAVADRVAYAMSSGDHAGWTSPERDAIKVWRDVPFGDGVRGDLYLPAGAEVDHPLPVAIWLHGFGPQWGYMWNYRWDTHPILALTRAGFAVFAFDQCGFGARQDEAHDFARRFPDESRLGRMVSDTRAAMDMLAQVRGLDPQRIALFGYSMGGMVAVTTAAEDPRVSATVSICGFTPMRTDTAARGTGGLYRYAVTRSLWPQLGTYLGREEAVPVDFPELLAATAPRPMLVVQPQLDREANVQDVQDAVSAARRAYDLAGAPDALQLDTPWDYHRLPESTEDRAVAWLARQLSAGAGDAIPSGARK